LTMPCNRAPFDRSRLEPATSRAFRNRKRISCHTVDVATHRAPSLVVSAPLSCSPSARPPADRSLLRPNAAKRRTCAVLVVSHHLDGLRHRRHRELVASPCRPWGSPGCWVRACMPASLRRHSLGARPSRAFPSTDSCRCVTARACPPAVAARRRPTSRLRSIGESVVAVFRCRTTPPEALLGFPVLERVFCGLLVPHRSGPPATATRPGLCAARRTSLRRTLRTACLPIPLP
jgi:hypothetical protein